MLYLFEFDFPGRNTPSICRGDLSGSARTARITDEPISFPWILRYQTGQLFIEFPLKYTRQAYFFIIIYYTIYTPR
jgi:hypothetical protein